MGSVLIDQHKAFRVFHQDIELVQDANDLEILLVAWWLESRSRFDLTRRCETSGSGGLDRSDRQRRRTDFK